jgi:hypothetical protein
MVLKQQNLQHSPLPENATLPTTSLVQVIYIPITLITLIKIVIFTIWISQYNSTHLLGCHSTCTWPCVDATQRVILVGVWLFEAHFSYTFTKARWQPCLSKISPTFVLIPAISVSNETLFPKSYFHSILWVFVAQYDFSTAVQGWWVWLDYRVVL